MLTTTQLGDRGQWEVGRDFWLTGATVGLWEVQIQKELDPTMNLTVSSFSFGVESYTVIFRSLLDEDLFNSIYMCIYFRSSKEFSVIIFRILVRFFVSVFIFIVIRIFMLDLKRLSFCNIEV